MSSSTIPLADDPQQAPGTPGGNGDSLTVAERAILQPRASEHSALDIPTADDAFEPLAERRLILATPVEAASRRWMFLFVALALASLQHALSHTYWAPGHYGNNQNAYLVAGKLLATTGSTGFEPKTPWEFVGWMWNMAEEGSKAAGGGWVYPKYPAGLPLLNAIVYKSAYSFGGTDAAVYWTYKVSPLCTTAATLGVFFILRLIANSFVGVIGMIGFATLSVVLVLMNNPYSHAADMAFVTWGIYALLKWWQAGGWWRGALAGFLLGYAATIRYTEGLLVLPIAAVVLCSMRWHRPAGWAVAWSLFAVLMTTAGVLAYHHSDAWSESAAATTLPTTTGTDRFETSAIDPEWYKSKYVAMSLAGLAVAPIAVMTLLMMRAGHARLIARLAVPLLAWAFPLVVLVVFNLFTFGSLTGYDSTNESTGFTLKEMARKWRWGIDQLYNTGLYILLPLAVGGLIMGFKWNWRVALVLTLWFVPSTLLYFSYYWGMNLPVWGFLRFFASVLPVGVIAAMWLLHHAAQSNETIEPIARRRLLVGGLIVATTVGLIMAIGTVAFDLDWRFTDRAELGLIGIALAAATIAAIACFPSRGASAAGAIAIGTLVAFPAAIHLNVSDAALERDHTISTNLNHAGEQIRRVAPDGSLVFVNSQRVGNFLQFAGNYELYGSDYIVGGRPVPQIRGGPDNDNPNPIQPARAKFVAQVYATHDTKARVKAATDLCVEAIQAGRRVFVVKEVDSAGALINEFTRGGRLKAVEVAHWTDPARMSSRAVSSLTTAGADGIARRDPWRWRIVEMKLADTPTTTPTNPPATNPAE